MRRQEDKFSDEEEEEKVDRGRADQMISFSCYDTDIYTVYNPYS